MEIPYDRLKPEVLTALIEEYVSRHGTDYGMSEISLEKKTEQVLRLLKKGEAVIVWDVESESCDIREKPQIRSQTLDPK